MTGNESGTSFRTILEKHRTLAYSESDKGTRFERLIQGFLKTDPRYSDLFRHVCLWKDFPYKNAFGGHDVGIDLVAVTKDGEYWAIQCKCYQEHTRIEKGTVDSFLATSGKTFPTEKGDPCFSTRLWIATSDNWSKNAEEVLHNQNPPVIRLTLPELENAGVDWEKLDEGIFGTKARKKRKDPRSHQTEAIQKIHRHFQTADRGKLIMACGTGKTFTALKAAEYETDSHGLILVLVPSIALLGQTLREWYENAELPISAICICSDSGVSKKASDADQMSIIDLALPASTNVDNIVRQFTRIETTGNNGMTVVFSTYQSIDVIAEVQKRRDLCFDLIICDEAHRTTGVTIAGEDESAFVKVHNNTFLAGKKRLYMTATPRIFSDSSKKKADEGSAVLCSMDDEKLYGTEMYRLGFGQAVEGGLLTDYKVLVLTLSDKDVPPAVQKMVAGISDSSIDTDDISKLIGCVNALSKQIAGDDGIIAATDPDPMKRAVAFCSKIRTSKDITEYFNSVPAAYVKELPAERQVGIVPVESKHIDGTMGAIDRDRLLDWLKEGGDGCRILTNVRCLSEGVDVPSLDAVIFLSARNSQVDVVQSVGRVMRRAEGKKFGYIVIPVIVPSDVPPERVLDKNQDFKVVWDVLNALRAHDDRFNATINKIELNKKKPDNILIGGSPVSFDEDGNAVSTSVAEQGKKTIQTRLQLQFEELKGVIYARMVKKVGDTPYWDNWAKDVADIAEKQRVRIEELVKEPVVSGKFDQFVSGLRENINPEISEAEAVYMLSQHMITRPVFEALFENYSFAAQNPVSVSIQKMIDVLDDPVFSRETESLAKFYDSVRKRVGGIDNAEGRQRVIVKLYDQFFRVAFPKMADQLGIVYTPVEVVDFIIRSVEDVLQKEFGRGMTDENVHILDPFTGTGTFITRLLSSGIIQPADLPRKYREEIHANEIVLLAYYIAAVNIENVFHDLTGGGYESFPGICLTDTFQLGEFTEGEHIASEFFPKNSERVNQQKKTPITVIMGNPPYSVGQKSANDNARNMAYPRLEEKIAGTYASDSVATNKNSLYDSYIKAFRWATDRLDKTHGGVICFVSNGGWLDGSAMDGFRKHLEREFNRIYVFDLRGNARTSGELRRREKDNVFGQGTRTPVTITLLVKNPAVPTGKATIFYHDIGDYLSQEEKLRVIRDFGSVSSIDWVVLTPNAEGDWINLRNSAFGTYIPIGDKGGKEAEQAFFVPVYSRGLETARDAWCYNSSKTLLAMNMQRTITYYNTQVDDFSRAKSQNTNLLLEDFIPYDPKEFSWARQQKRDLNNLKKYTYIPESIRISQYRPFFRQYSYFNKQMNNIVSHLPKLFPTADSENLVICVSGVGVIKEFSTLITKIIPDLELVGKSQCFPLYYYESTRDHPAKTIEASQSVLFEAETTETETTYTRKDGVSDFILTKARTQYQHSGITKEDIFYYVYGFLHSPGYRETFSADLKKMLPRIPLVENYHDFMAFSNAGRMLADLHLHYETVPPYPDVDVSGLDSGSFRVKKMKFPKKDQKDTIHYNESITISGIPEKAYAYIVNGRSALEWIMDRYQVTTDKDSGITNDPNDWAEESGNPRYILDLILRVITVSIQTMEIVEKLPKVEFA